CGPDALPCCGSRAWTSVSSLPSRSPSSVRAFLSRGATDDLHQLCGDAGLADLVRVKGQGVNEIAGSVGGVLHCDHLGRVLAGLVLEHGLEDLGLDVARQEPVEHRLRIRFVYVVRTRSGRLALARWNLRGDEHTDRRFLPDRGDPLRVAEQHRVDVALRVLLESDGDGRQNLALTRTVGRLLTSAITSRRYRSRKSRPLRPSVT